MLLKMLIKISAILAVFSFVSAKKYCKQDSDCDSLGELYCIKSACDWGVCSCPRGKAAKYLGSSRNFRCVPLKRVDESCSNDGDKGVCGAADSYCDESKDKCVCNSGKVPIWGGEMCTSRTTLPGAGETCGSGSISTCNDGTTCSLGNNALLYTEVKTYNFKPVCACPNNQKLVMPNYYSANLFIGKTDPLCESNKIGDTCLKNQDCPSYVNSNSNVECKNNVCTCKSTFVPDYWSTSCKKPLVFGVKCHTAGGAASDEHCDGSKGLTCGDVCSLTDVVNADLTCTCGVLHTKSGTTCTAIKKGGSCKGDLNCKGFSPRGVCVDGTCKEGAVTHVISLFGLIVALLAYPVLGY